MTIAVGDRIPDITLLKVREEDGPETIATGAFFAGRTIALFAVPGAYTPTCTARHLPSFLDNADALLARGVDEICCTAVNDPFVLLAWSDSQHVDGRITLLADGSATFATALGLTLDLRERGLGIRSRRYAMLVEDGVVRHLGVEAGPEMTVSSAESLLAALQPTG